MSTYFRCPAKTVGRSGTRLCVSTTNHPVAESRVWNSLPPDVTSVPTLIVFWKRLKTASFPDHYCFRFLVLYTVYSSDLAVLY